MVLGRVTLAGYFCVYRVPMASMASACQSCKVDHTACRRYRCTQCERVMYVQVCDSLYRLGDGALTVKATHLNRGASTQLPFAASAEREGVRISASKSPGRFCIHTAQAAIHSVILFNGLSRVTQFPHLSACQGNSSSMSRACRMR